MNNNQDISVVDKNDAPFNDVINDMSVVPWMDFLDVRMPHALDPKAKEKLADVKEIFEYFKTNHKDAPFESFKEFMQTIPGIVHGETKASLVLKKIRLMRIAKKFNMNEGKWTPL